MSSFLDVSSIPMTNGGDEARAAYTAYTNDLLGYGKDLRNVFAATDTAPECLLLNANSAILHLAFEGREGWDAAQPYLENMRAMAPRATRTEQLFAEAVEAWARLDYFSALRAFEEAALETPQDVVSLKWAQYHAFNLGDHQALYRLGHKAVEAHPDRAYVHGLLAFGLEQTGNMAEAERHARRAVEIATDDAWAHHALAHVMETEARPRDGADWMADCAAIWEQKGIFIRSHNWWHTALFHLALGDEARVLEIFDRQLWGEWPEFPQEQIGAASLLWRLELLGLDAGDRWQPVVEQVRMRSGEHLFCFHDLHYLFALAKGGAPHEAEAHIASMSKSADRLSGEMGVIWRDVALPAAHGILAYARGDCESATTLLAQSLPHLNKIGGSHAQRAIFSDTYIAAQRLQAGNAAQ